MGTPECILFSSPPTSFPTYPVKIIVHGKAVVVVVVVVVVVGVVVAATIGVVGYVTYINSIA